MGALIGDLVKAHAMDRFYAWIRTYEEEHGEWPAGSDVMAEAEAMLREAGYDMDYAVGPDEWALELLPSRFAVYEGLSQHDVAQKRQNLAGLLVEGIDYQFVLTNGAGR